MYKLAIIGSRKYNNKEKIREVILDKQVRQQRKIELYGPNDIKKARNDFLLEIVSGGCPTGADLYAKELALELGIPYVEFPPAHARWNEYCLKGKECYSHIYKTEYFFARNTEIAEYCDSGVAFICKGVKANGTMDTVNKICKLGKVCKIIEG